VRLLDPKQMGTENEGSSPPVPPLFTKLANAQTQEIANAECVAAIRENYLHNPAVGLENALHACWETVNPYGIRAVFALANKAKGLDRMEDIERKLGEKWIMWMEGDHSRGLLPLYASLCLDDGDPTNFYKTRIANYSSYISMWENTSPSKMLLECLDLLGESGHPPLPSRKTICMIDRLIVSALQPETFDEILDRLKAEQYPKQLSHFLDKLNETVWFNVRTLKVLLKAPKHQLWEHTNVWTSCIMNPECLDHLAMNLRPAAFESYKKFGEKMFAKSGTKEAQWRWRASLKKRQSIEDAAELDERTTKVAANPRQSRL
jgi:hypothetical protein